VGTHDLISQKAMDTTKTVAFDEAPLCTMVFCIWIVSMYVLGKRIKHARVLAGLSQEGLGLAAGLDEMSASTRMNRYELGRRVPSPDFVERLGKVLNVPAAYFYAVDEDEAELLIGFSRLGAERRGKLMDYLSELSRNH
jgi:transcriptional regulator with XRE-family HTH domain